MFKCGFFSPQFLSHTPPPPPPDGYYIYHESDNVANGQNARLLSPSITTSATQICVQFRYYMYGADSETKLRVLAKNSGSESEIWMRKGIQSPSWLAGEITVPKTTTEEFVVSLSSSM